MIKKHIRKHTFFYLLLLLCAGAFRVRAFDASSTSFFVRQDVSSLGGNSTSASFSAQQSGSQNTISTSTSASFIVGSGFVYTQFRSVAPSYEQKHFHWRNDDGTETTATSATSGNQDTALSSIAKSTVKRLRVEISNEGGTIKNYATQQFRIEYALKSGTCASSTYTDVGAVGGDWDMGASQLTEGGNTTNIATSTGGVTDENATFISSNGGQRETTSQTGSVSVPSDSFIELEYAIQATTSATNGGVYCFRVTNAGATTNFLYTTYPTATVSGGNSTPVVSAVSINNGNPITLTAGATTSVAINFTVTDTDGCSDVFTSGNTTSTAFRFGVGTSCSPNNLNCYTVATTTNNCSAGTSANATATVALYYFAQATDASSTFPSQDWEAAVFVADAAGATSSATSTGVEVNSLLAISASSSISYGSVTAGANTGGTNQLTAITNAGNTSSTLTALGDALSSGANSIATSSQHYATSTFTFGGSEQALSGSATAISGLTLTSPTSTNAVSSLLYWGITIPSGSATGTYSGSNTISAVFTP